MAVTTAKPGRALGLIAGGLFFEETTASSLVKVRFGAGTPTEGLLVGPTGDVAPSKPDVVNIGCVPVGRAIFEARPDVNVYSALSFVVEPGQTCALVAVWNATTELDNPLGLPSARVEEASSRPLISARAPAARP